MPFNTRIDGRSPLNKELHIINPEGSIIATIIAIGKSAHLAIDTLEGYQVSKVKETEDE